MQINLILVHSGNIFPNHINDTIKIAKKHNFDLHLIIDKKFFHLIENKECKLEAIENLEDFRYKTYSIQNHDTNFRDNFFTRTSSRFILLDNYISKNNLYSCFHIENDIALFDNFQQIKNEIEKTDKDTALIMDHPNRCVPSIIWLKNKIASNRLGNFIYDNNKLDDMKNLAKYFLENREKIINLPIVPFDLIDKNTNINFGNYFNIFGSIFDGAAIGQYLYGIDTEDKTKNTEGFVNETSVFKPDQYTIWFNDNKDPYIKYKNNDVKINNLHIHSKSLFKLL